MIQFTADLGVRIARFQATSGHEIRICTDAIGRLLLVSLLCCLIPACTSEPKRNALDSQINATPCALTCPSFALVAAQVSIDPSSCTSFTYPADAGPRAGQKTICFANHTRIESQAIGQGYEVRFFSGERPKAPVLVEQFSAAYAIVLDGATRRQLMRFSSPDSSHVKVECDGRSVLLTTEQVKRCVSRPSDSLVSACQPGVCQ